MMMNLLCDEEWIASSPDAQCLTDQGYLHYLCNSKSSLEEGNIIGWVETTREDCKFGFLDCLQKEGTYMPDASYAKHLLESPNLLHARFRAIQFFVKSHYRFNLDLETVFNAANYFDRFVAKNQSNVGTVALVELLSVACLSIAAKFHEVSTPDQLRELQMENLENSFTSSSIRRMELSVLQTVEWRLGCVTAYSYVDMLMTLIDSLHEPHHHGHLLHSTLKSRVVELILATLSDPKFLEFKPSAIAASALRCGLEELIPSKSNSYISSLFGDLIPHDQKEDINNCYKFMEESVADPLYSLIACGCGISPYLFPSSPVTVMETPQHIGKFYSHIDDHSLTAKSSSNFTFPSNPKKRKLEGDVGSNQIHDA